MSAEKKVRRIPWLAVALILALSISNLLLITQNLSLRRSLNSAGRIGASANSLKAGETVTPIVGTNLDGHPYQLQYEKDGRRQLLCFSLPVAHIAYSRVQSGAICSIE